MRLLPFCDVCKKLSFRLKYHEWDTSPGTGRFGYLCNDCINSCVSFRKKMGMLEGTIKTGINIFEGYVGDPFITSSEHGENAYGSILAKYSNGSRTPVICGHGGS